MIKAFKILFVFVTVIFHSCTGQERESKEQIIDPIESVPFDVKRGSIFLSLPDSISAKKVTGTTALELFINSTGKVEGFNIIKFSLMIKEDTLINYFGNSTKIKDQGSYPEKVQSYYSLLSDYVRDIEITKRQGVAPQKINKTTILVRFK